MEVSIDQVKKLREKTGAGMMDCKKALMESNGDFEKAIEYLRKKGAAASQKRSERIAKEGYIVAKASDDKKKAVIAEVNSETDFVAKSSAFVKFANLVADTALNNGSSSIEELKENKTSEGISIADAHNDILAAVGEKIEITRIDFLDSKKGFFSVYNHTGNKVCSVIEIEGEMTERGQFLGNELAMQVVAMKPIAISRENVDEETIQKEKDIYIIQAKNEKKPDNIAEKIAANKVEKYFQDNCLIEQEYIKEPDKSVKDIINMVSKETGQDYKVVRMIRYQLGETIS